MGDDTPTPGRGRLDRPVADHLRQAFAQVTNPAIDPERERVGHGPAGRARPSAGAARRAAARATDRSPGSGRSSSTSTDCSPRSRRRRDAVRTLDATWDPARRAGRSRGRPRPAGRPTPSPPRARGVEVLVLSDAAWSVDRLPIPSILAIGAVHTALTAAGLRGRTDVAVERRRRPRRPLDGDGPRRRRHRRPSAARHRARRRAGRDAWRRGR